MKDLTSLLGPGRHHMMAFAFKYDAMMRRFMPVTRKLTVFEHGVNDDVPFPFVGAGYRTPRVPDRSVHLTDCYAGGAWSWEWDTQFLRARIEPGRVMRVFDAASGTPDTPTFDVYGGDVTPVSESISEFRSIFFKALLHGGEAYLLPQNHAADCALYLGPTRLDFPSDGGWLAREECYVQSGQEVAKSHGRPNTMRFSFDANVGSVRLPDNAAAPADGSFAVLDLDVRVDVARGKIRDGRFMFLEESDAAAAAEWRAAVARLA